MNQALFRQQVIERRSERLHGAVILSQPLPPRLATLFLAGIVALAIAFLLRHDYARKQTVSGTLVPDRGLLELRAPAAGSIALLHAEPDAHVEAGEPLFTLRLDHTLAGSAALTHGLLEDLRVQQVALQQQLRELEGLIANERQLLDIRNSALARVTNLRARSLLAASDYETVLAQVLQQKGAIGRLQLQHSELRAQAAELHKQQLRTQAEQDTTVVAPVAGRVTTVLRQQGMSVSAQEALVMLLPDGAELQAELWLPSSASGFVESGQVVNLRYEAFPYQKFGVQRAHIAAIAASAVQMQQGGQPLFRARAKLERQDIMAFGATLPLRPGMALQADIVVDRRSLFEWLLEPLYSITGRAGLAASEAREGA